MLVSLPLIKGFYDLFTAPTTGYFVIAGLDSNALAIATAIPWIFPIAAFICFVYDLSKKDEEEPRSIGGIKIPKIK